jgi:hypothetical protein
MRFTRNNLNRMTDGTLPCLSRKITSHSISLLQSSLLQTLVTDSTPTFIITRLDPLQSDLIYIYIYIHRHDCVTAAALLISSLISDFPILTIKSIKSGLIQCSLLLLFIAHNQSVSIISREFYSANDSSHVQYFHSMTLYVLSLFAICSLLA